MERQKAKGKRQKAKGRHFINCQLSIINSLCLLPFAFCLLISPALAAATLENYTQRVEEAAKLAADAVENDYSRNEENELLQRVIALVPATEDIAREPNGKDLTHVDNAWLQQAVSKLNDNDEDERYSQLVEISQRLNALSRSLRATLDKQSAPATNAPRERLQQILARSEYQPEEEKDSAIQGWIKKIKQRINELLAKLFLSNSSPSTPNPRTLQAIRWVIIAALIASLVWAAVLLMKRFQLREAKLKDDGMDDDVREILGEQFDADVTADDLLKTAAEMARKGEYRMAIRRAYLALLYELEQRGKLHLHRAKTNRDYLGELKNEQQIYPSVTTLTNNYERVWYGDGAATMEDYSGFIEKYRDVAR